MKQAKFVVPYDFSVHSRAALFAATDLARRFGGADLHLVHVIQTPAFAYGYAPYGGAAAPPPLDLTAVRERAAEALRDVADGIEGLPGKIEPHVVEAIGIADAIREAAEDLDADLVVMGTHGRSGLAHAFLGSVAERTLRAAPCPVLTVKAKEDES